jgi:tetratricopeptide (TPR) repeat protein
MHRWWIAAILGGVFALKLVVVLQLQHHPLLQPDAGLDTTAYVTLASKVLGGNPGLGPGLYFVSPLYIYFLAAVLAIFDSFLAVRVVQIVLGTLAVGAIFLMAREWVNERAAWLATGLAAFTGLFTFYETLILQASIDAFLTSAGLLSLTWGLRPAPVCRPAAKRSPPGRTGAPSGGWFLAAGAIFGVQTLNRPNVLLAVAGMAALLLATRRVRPAALIAAGLLAGMAPVAIRNVTVADQWSFVSSHGGLNFYIGNSDTATGFYRPIPGIRPTIEGQETDARRVAERATGRSLTDAEVSDYFVGLGVSWVQAHPGAAIALFAKKFAYVFSAQHIALPHSYPFYAHDSSTILRFLAVGPWLLVPLGVIGLLAPVMPGGPPAAPNAAGRSGARVHQRGGYLIWASFVPFYAAAVAVFFVAERYRLPLLVPLSVAAGAAIEFVVSAVAARRFTALALPAAAFIALAVLTNWPTGLNDGRWEEGLRLVQRLVILGRYDEADVWARRIRFREPRPGATDYGVGAQLLVANQPEKAVPHLRAALAADPAQPHVEYALGRALLQSDAAGEAVPHLKRGFDAGIELPMGGYDLPVALQAVGDSAGAAQVIRRIRPGDQEDVEAWLRLGRLAAQARAPEVAEQFFQHAVQMEPDRAPVRQQHGLNLVVLGRYEDAARELAAAVRLDGRDADSLAHLAFCEFNLGRFSDALAHARAALALDPANQLAAQLLRRVEGG